MPKADRNVEVNDGEDAEETTSGIHDNANGVEEENGDSKEHEKDGEEDGQEEDEDGSEDELYEVEAILTHKKQKGKVLYLVKWLGYDENDNSWEPQENLVSAKELLDAYWDKQKELQESKKRKRSTEPTPKKGKKRKDEDNDDEMDDQLDEEEDSEYHSIQIGLKRSVCLTLERITAAIYDPEKRLPQDLLDLDSWEDAVEQVDTVEQGNKEDELIVFLKWKSGHNSMHPATRVHTKCPLKLFAFYEKNLKFKPGPNKKRK
ncbi:hypothetical protein HK104_008511 [Borealophlyctis nickersoniae]|nr:hypothetical protein HK104_008511 [Borealophlyctis nickersoniae]